MRRLTFFTVLVAFVFSCGGQWPVLQGVAWANMVREYSEAVPFTQAVQMTFSGPVSLRPLQSHRGEEKFRAAAKGPGAGEA